MVTPAKMTQRRLKRSTSHPSGNPQPRKQDIQITREIIEAGKRLGIDVHDHIIIGLDGHSSMRSMGLM